MKGKKKKASKTGRGFSNFSQGAAGNSEQAEKSKKRKKLNISACLLGALAIAILLVTPLAKIRGEEERVSREVTILTLANVDEFEGGTWSRTSFLQDIAQLFTKSNKDVYINVMPMTEYQLLESFKGGNPPDIVSYSIGVGEKIYEYLTPYTRSINISGQFERAGMSGSKQYAVAWCTGSYVEAQRVGQKVSAAVCGASAYTSSSKAYSGGKVVEGDFSQRGAYDRFLMEKDLKLIGTQRDVYRLAIRSEKYGENYEFTPLGGYLDLAMYASVSTQNVKNILSAERFIEFLQQENVQKRLYKIGMINVLGEMYYEDGVMRDLEKSVAKVKDIENVFSRK